MREPVVEVEVEVHGNGRAAGKCLERRSQAACGQQRRVDAAGDLPQAVQCVGQSAGHRGQPLAQLGHLGRDARLGIERRQGERDEVLLDTVVQIALDAPSGLVGGDYHRRAREAARSMRAWCWRRRCVPIRVPLSRLPLRVPAGAVSTMPRA
jgi:hypothetical protein